jgi:transcriptional regulator with GAF, ATPase, and Fis domain
MTFETKKLLEYSWPENIREIEHIIERSLILTESSELLIPDFEIVSITSEKKQNQTELLSLDEISRRHIIKVLHHTKWRIRGETGAAKILEMKPSTLEYRIKKLGIKK